MRLNQYSINSFLEFFFATLKDSIFGILKLGSYIIRGLNWYGKTISRI
jgi:hypothetical protein